MSQSLFYLTIALHVLGITSAHLQEHKTTVTTASGNRYTVLLSAVIMEELELWFQLFHDSSRQQYSVTVEELEPKFQLFHHNRRQQYGVTVTRCCSYSCFVLLKMGAGDAQNM